MNHRTPDPGPGDHIVDVTLPDLSRVRRAGAQVREQVFSSRGVAGRVSITAEALRAPLLDHRVQPAEPIWVGLPLRDATPTLVQIGMTPERMASAIDGDEAHERGGRLGPGRV